MNIGSSVSLLILQGISQIDAYALLKRLILGYKCMYVPLRSLIMINHHKSCMIYFSLGLSHA